MLKMWSSAGNEVDSKVATEGGRRREADKGGRKLWGGWWQYQVVSNALGVRVDVVYQMWKAHIAWAHIVWSPCMSPVGSACCLPLHCQPCLPPHCPLHWEHLVKSLVALGPCMASTCWEALAAQPAGSPPHTACFSCPTRSQLGSAQVRCPRGSPPGAEGCLPLGQ